MKIVKQICNQFHSLITGEKMVSELEKYRFICYTLAVIHILIMIRFYLLHYTILYVYNIFAIIFYFVLGYVFTKQRKFAQIYYFCYAEITLFASSATILAGWDWGFMIYLIALTPVSFYLAYSSPQFGRNIRKPMLFVFSSMTIFVATKILSLYITPLYTRRIYDSKLLIVYCANASISFLALLLFSILFTIEIRQNEVRLEEQYALLENISSKDPLTGLLNRRSMDKYMMDAVSQTAETGHIFSVILGDIDDFKKVNDTYGHLIGDQVLIEVAKTISGISVPGCRICRWGGEEILIYVPENEIITKGMAEKIRQSVSRIAIPTQTGTVNVTMTFGVAEYSPGLMLNKLVSIADHRLYYGKQHGKNQVVDKTEE